MMDDRDIISLAFSDVSPTTRRKIRRRIGHLAGEELAAAINTERAALEDRRKKQEQDAQAARYRRAAEEARIRMLPAKDQPPRLCPQCWQLRKATSFTGVPGGICRDCHYNSLLESSDDDGEE